MESADKPGSVVDDHSSGTNVTACLKRPTRTHCGPQLMGSYLVLLQVGFTIAIPVTRNAVRSYRTFSPLPIAKRKAVSFLLHFPWTRVPQALPGTLPSGARTFLYAINRWCSDRLADSARRVATQPFWCKRSGAREVLK